MYGNKGLEVPETELFYTLFIKFSRAEIHRKKGIK